MPNLTQIEREIESTNLEELIKALNMDIHDNCDLNNCNACLGLNDTPDVEYHHKKMCMNITHIGMI